MSELESQHAQECESEAGAGVAESARILLLRVMRILRGCGLKTSTLREIAEEALIAVESVPDPHAHSVTARQGLMCCDVVLKWRRDPRFLDSDGLPSQLSLHGESPTFDELVEASAPGEDLRHMLVSMTELGVIRKTEGGMIELISESVVACSGRDGSLVASECVLEHICGFLGSVEYNVFDKPSRAKGRFERACYASVPQEIVPVLEQMISTRGQNFVDVVDEWLARRSVKTTRKENCVLVGAGAYVFVRKVAEQKS
jgi:uncharacterized protein DUF6502